MIVDSAESGFDFDEWLALARSDPPEFERCRRVLLEHLIQTAPDAEFARRFQCHIDLQRIGAPTPLQAALRLSMMMLEAFRELEYYLRLACESGVQQRAELHRR